jgi:hypothetical protein
MTTNQRKPRKVRVNLSITLEAQKLVFDRGYASARTMGDFISRLIVEHHAQQTNRPTPEQVAGELRRLADLLASM